MSGISRNGRQSHTASGSGRHRSGAHNAGVRGAEQVAREGHAEPERVSIEDIEERLRRLTGSAGSTVAAARESGPAALLLAAAVAAVAVAYLLGRRSGKLSSAVIEIRRS